LNYVTRGCCCLIGALLAVAVAAPDPARADVSSPARLAKFARLQDWTGIWLVEGTSGNIDPKAPRGQFQGQTRDYPPLTPQWEKKYEGWFEQARDHSETYINPYRTYCVSGWPNLFWAPWDIEFVVTPEEVFWITNERETRHIYTDGRGHPDDDDLWPTFWGHSIGHWENGTLVVDTVAIKNNLWVDNSALRFSDQLRTVERIRMLSHDKIEDQLTFIDPVALTKPWTITRTYARVTQGLNWMTDQVCNENDRDPVENGHLTEGSVVH